MKRIALALVLAVMVLGLLGGPALAQQYPPEPGGPDDTPGDTDDGNGLAATGLDVTVGMVAAGGLVLMGGAALFAGRRRTRASGS